MAPQAGRRRRVAALVLSPLARQFAALGLALCAVALSLAYPLRGYLQQQAAEQAAVAEQHQLEQQIADLKEQQAALQDPAYIKAEAKRRLQYVTPGDTVYVIKVPKSDADATAGGTGGTGPATGTGSAAAGGGSATIGSGSATTDDDGAPDGAGSATGDEPWYASLWGTLSGDSDSAVTPAG